jgi:hypothetical protein
MKTNDENWRRNLMPLTVTRLTRWKRIDAFDSYKSDKVEEIEKNELTEADNVGKKEREEDTREDDATENDQSQFGAHFSQPYRSEEEVTVIALNEVFSRRILDVLCCLGFALMKKKRSDKLLNYACAFNV